MFYQLKDLENMDFEIIKTLKENSWVCCLARGYHSEFIFKVKDWGIKDL